MMAMVIGCGISSPTFGFDLLDRMLGIKCGSSCDTAACDAPADCELSQHAGVKSLLADAKLQRAKKALLAVVKNLYAAVSQRQKVAKTRAIHLLQAAVDYSRNCSQ